MAMNITSSMVWLQIRQGENYVNGHSNSMGHAPGPHINSILIGKIMRRIKFRQIAENRRKPVSISAMHAVAPARRIPVFWISPARLSKFLQQPVVIIQFLLRPGAFSGAPA
jgi:hypothetical protein